MAAAQGTGGHSEAVEEAEDGLHKPDEAERCLWLQHDGRGHLQGSQLQTGPVPQMRYECGQLPAKPESAILAKQEREPTGIGRSSFLLPEKYLKPCFDVAPYT